MIMMVQPTNWMLISYEINKHVMFKSYRELKNIRIRGKSYELKYFSRTWAQVGLKS